MDLSTIDPSNPPNSELARIGASRIRDAVTAAITSFALEHHLTGEHKIGVGASGARPVAGHIGRFFINLTAGQLEYDTGTSWVPVPISSASLGQFSSVAAYNEDTDETLTVIDTTEIVLSEVDLTITKGSLVQATFALNGWANDSSPPHIAVITLRVRIDGTAGVADGTIVRTAGQLYSSIDDGAYPWGATILYSTSLQSLGVHRYKLTGQATFAGIWTRRTSYAQAIEHA